MKDLIEHPLIPSTYVVSMTTRGVMFDNLKSLPRVFSSHQFRASWQSKQMKDLIEHPLPSTYVVSMTTQRTIVAQVRISCRANAIPKE